jgi:hypothetical protein
MPYSLNPNPAPTEKPIKFSSGQISVTDVCDEYSVPRNLRALQTRTSTFLGIPLFPSPAKYYSADSTEGSAGTSGSISLNQFRGKYSSKCTGSFAGQDGSEAASSNSHGVQSTIAFNGSYVIQGERIKSITLNFSAGHNPQGTFNTITSSSESITLTANGSQLHTGNASIQLDLNVTIGTSIPLSVKCYSYSKNGYNDEASIEVTWQYTVTPYGITGPN